jgi:predicted transcriptional regulator
METKTAGDIMIPIEKYPQISYNATLREAVEEIEQASLEVHGRRSLPRALLVMDDNLQLIGMVRRRDILRGLEPKFLQAIPMHHPKKLFDIEVDPELAELAADKGEQTILERAERKVSQVMQPITATVNYYDHLGAIISIMITRDLSLLPVLKDKKVVGVVRSVGVFYEVANLLDQADSD